MMIRDLLSRIKLWLLGPDYSFTESQAYQEGFESPPGAENQWSNFKDRIAFRKGQTDAQKWADSAW